jgi:transposase
VQKPSQAEKSKQRQEALLVKTEEALDKIVEATQRAQRRLRCKGKIGVRVGRVLGKYKVRQFFTLVIEQEHFTYKRNEAAITKAEQLDGLYAIRSSLKQAPEAAGLVANHKRLSTVEQAFRTMKTISLRVRPIYHRKKDRGIAHVFLCMLAYYVEYHLRRNLAPMLSGEDDPVGKAAQHKNALEHAKPSPQAKKKARTKRDNEGEQVMSFAKVVDELAGLCRLVDVPKVSVDKTPEGVLVQKVSPTQQRSLNFWVSNLCSHSAHRINNKNRNYPHWRSSIYPPKRLIAG